MVKRVLAIDDNDDLLALLREVFAEENYDYVACSRPRDAYQLARQSAPDLILLDVTMPAMNGWEVLNLFVLDRQLRHIPVVLMTSSVVEAERRLSRLARGDVSILGKPFDVDRLLAHVADAVGEVPLLDDLPERVAHVGGPVLLRDEP